MENIKRCSSCVLPITLPRISLDTDGVCNSCKSYKDSFSDINSMMLDRKEEVDKIIDRYKKLGRPYDCLVTLSGGKDSTYALYICSKVYGMKCLCVTFDNGYMTTHAKSNIRNAVEAAGADHLFYTVNQGLLRDLYKLFLLKAADLCPVCMRGIEQCRHIISKDYGIPLIISGGGRRISYLDIPEVFQGGEPAFFKNIVSGTHLEKKAISMMPAVNMWDLNKFLRLTNKITRKIFKRDALRMPAAQSIYILHIFDHFAPSPEEMLDKIKTEMGWEGPPGDVEHMDCKLHHIAAYIRQVKFPDVTDATFHHSGLIRRGLMTREEALMIEDEKLKRREPPEELFDFLKEIGLSLEEFHDAVRGWRKVEQYRNSRPKSLINTIYERIESV